MKKLILITQILFVVLAITSCKKQKNNLENSSTESITTVNTLTETTTSEVKEENQNYQFSYDYTQQDDILGIIPGKNGQPDEVDIASAHKNNSEDWFMFDMSPDGNYYIQYNGEYNYTYARYYVPVKGDRKDLNLIMLKEESPIYNPNDMGANNKEICSLGCEFIAIARSTEPVVFNDQISYWFKISKK